MDRTQDTQLSSDEIKKETQLHWSHQPCGSNYSEKAPMTREYFEEIEQHRYETHPFILRAIRSFDIRGKKVLEVGFGMGTDHVNLVRQGGVVYGIELTPKHAEATAQRLALYGLKSRLLVGDAEILPYRDESFDLVYSFGVIHHSPDTERIVREIRRVLKPGGRCWATVYHKNSLFFWWSIFAVHHVLLGGFLRESLKSRLSRIEYPNDNPNLVIRLYTKKTVTTVFEEAGFQAVKTSVDQIEPTHIAVFHRFLSRRMVEPLAHRFGWYVIADAQK